MKWSELTKIMKKKGWSFYRHGSKHDLYAHPDYEYKIAVGRHEKEEVPTGTYTQIKKQVGF